MAGPKQEKWKVSTKPWEIVQKANVDIGAGEGDMKETRMLWWGWSSWEKLEGGTVGRQ